MSEPHPRVYSAPFESWTRDPLFAGQETVVSGEALLAGDDIVDDIAAGTLDVMPPMDIEMGMDIELIVVPVPPGPPEPPWDMVCGVLPPLEPAAAELAGLPSQVPKADWHPVPQYASLLPQFPYALQQSPKPEPRQVQPPLLAPQSPFRETRPEEDELVDGAATLLADAGLEGLPALPPLPPVAV